MTANDDDKHETNDEPGASGPAEERAMQTRRSGPSDAIQTVRAETLLGARGLLHIEHEGERYTLRLTKNNRLILTK